jgi:hypothetical protein
VVVVEVIDDDVISELEHSKVLNILVERWRVETTKGQTEDMTWRQSPRHHSCNVYRV